MQDAVVPRVAREAQAEQARADRLRLRGVRARVPVPVAPEDAPAVLRVQAQNRARGQQKQRRQPRGDEIQHIVRLRRDEADIFIRRLHIAEHRVHRVDGLVEKAQRRAAEREIQKRRDDAVGRVFRHSLDGGPGDARGVQPRGIAADDHAYRLLRVREASRLQGGIDAHALLPQRSDREDLPAHHALEREAQIDGHPLRAIEDERREPRRDENRAQPDARAREDLAARCPGKQRAEPPLEQRDQLADPDNGVRQPMRVAHDKIDAEADQKGEKGPFQGVFPPFCSVKM